MSRQYNKRQIINNAFLRWIYILILCLGSMGIYGQQQTYPVQVYTQLIPPYTPHIPSYYTGTQSKLKVMLINTDMQQPTVNVYLRMKILSSSFSAVTPPEVYTPQIELQAGMPVTLSLNDLEPYFKKENLRVSGGQSEFYRTQMLPDNFYRFHFEVYEVGTNRLVSNTKIGFAQAMIASGEPPILNLPQKGSVIKESNTPSIMFSWTPKHMNSIAAAYGAEYDISLVEIYDKQVVPEAAFDYSRVLYTETTKSTSFIHTIVQPLLIPGMRYAWRVQAKAREGIDEISVFKNNGYSPVSWFDYTADCKIVQSCGAIYENGHVDISWQDVGAMEYAVEYRKKGTSRWYTGVINKPLLSQLYSLQAGKDYEYRIGSRCVTGDTFQYNDPQAFHIPDRLENGPNCGLMPNVNLTNQTPTRELQSGMPVLVGDFPVFITKVSGSGKFTGEGYVGIPYLQGAQIAVTFKDIVVNTDNRLVSGYFETKYDTKNNNLLFDADQYQTGGKGVGDIRSGEEQAAFKVDYTINPDIKALPVKADGTKDEIKEGTDYTISKGENGRYTFVLTDSEGKEHKVEADTMPATIENKNGNTYEVSEKGEVKPVSKNSDIKLDSSTKDTQSKLASLSFKATPNTKYALDEYRDVYDKVTEYKDQYKPEGTAITASAKFMLPGASDEIAVYIKENKDNKLIPEKVRFVTGKGKEYSATYDSQTKGWTLTIVGGQANDGQELYVVQDVGKDKYETLGKLNIFTYEPLKRSVTLVPVNGKNNNLDRQTVQDGLNEIYGKIGISWTVNILEKPFSYTPKNGSTFNVTGSGLLSMFTDDMKAINEAFKQSGKYQEDGLYLFVIGDKASESGTEGDMPLGSQFGYLFPNASIRTIAHEVGHGAFNLEHPFDRPMRISFPQKGMLEYNLMDYPTKDAEKWTELVKLQWDQTRAPGHVIGLFQKDKSGMSVADGGLLELQALLDKLGQEGFVLLKKCDTKIISTDSPLHHIAIFGDSYKYIAGILEESGQLKLSEITSIPASEIQKNTKLTIDKELTQFILLKKGDSYIICSVSVKHNYGLCDQSFKVTDLFYEYLKEDITKCASEKGIDKKYILETLQKLQSYARANQEIEFLYNGIAYILKNGEIVQSGLSDEGVNSGNWRDGTIDARIRLGFDENGIVQVKAFGFRTDLKLADGKTANLPELASQIKEHTNKFLIENRVNKFDLEAPVFKDDGETFADGKQIVIGGKNTGFIKIVSEGIGLTTTLLKTAKIEEDAYLDSPKGEVVIAIPGMGTGTIEAGVKTITDITEPVIMLYDLAVDKEARTEAYNGLVQIKEQVKDDPASLFPLLGEIILEEFSGNTSEEWLEANSDQTDSGRQSHLLTKGTVRTVASVFASGKFLAKVPDMADNLAKKMAKIKNLGKYDWRTVRRYFIHVQEVTGRPVFQKQIDKLKDALRNKEYKRLSKSELDAHRADFNKRKNQLIKEWEIETGEKWPTYEQDFYQNGKLMRKAGDQYDAHHLIENQFGGGR